MANIEVHIGNRVIPLLIRNSRLAKRLSLRISPAKDKVVMTLPRRASLASGMKFLNSKTDWVLANIEAEQPVALTDGTILPVLGRNLLIRRMSGRGTTFIDYENLMLTVYGAPEFAARRVKDFLKKMMREECTKRVETIAQKLGKAPSKVIISRAGSRWGSCTAHGVISLNWLLAFAPPHILDYVIAHETAHLIEMNHSPRFWRLVEQLYPDAKTARQWLKKEGYRLHRYE